MIIIQFWFIIEWLIQNNRIFEMFEIPTNLNGFVVLMKGIVVVIRNKTIAMCFLHMCVSQMRVWLLRCIHVLLKLYNDYRRKENIY